jgi:XapX domain-containing protein
MTAAIIGLILGLVVGAGCRLFDIPSPRPAAPDWGLSAAGNDLGLRSRGPRPAAGADACAAGCAMKATIGLILAFAIGFACRAFGIPSPAPPLILGALLVMAMTVGYIAVDRWMARPAQHAVNCAGPSGLPPSQRSTGD